MRQRLIWLVIAAAAAMPAFSGPILGSAQAFAVLGGSAVTNTGSTTLNGDLGIYPGSAITGGGITFIGASTVHNTPPGLDPVSIQAKTDLTSAYNLLASQPFTSNLSGQNLGTIGLLDAGVYRFDSTAGLTGTLTLDAQNNPNALFIFQIGTALTTASASVVNVINVNSNSNVGVYWVLGVTGGSGTGSATLGTTTVFAGNILALDSITLNNSAEILCGRALARNGAVTMDTNTISNNCNTYAGGTGRTDSGTLGFSGGAGSTQAVPEPGTAGLLSLVGLLGTLAWRKFRF